MSIMDMLRTYSRAELQKEAKKHKIKANLKNETLIEKLLEYFTKTKRTPSRRSSSSPLSSVPSSGANRKKAAKKIPRRSVPRAAQAPAPSLTDSHPFPSGFPAWYDPKQNRDCPRLPHTNKPRAPSPSDSTYTLNTPVSSPEHTPEPLAEDSLMEQTVRMMAEIDRQDQRSFIRLTELRKKAAALRSQTAVVRSALEAQISRRKRIETYFSHWRQMDWNWQFVEVWATPMRLARDRYGREYEITTSDEEEISEQEDATGAQEAQGAQFDDEDGSGAESSGSQSENSQSSEHTGEAASEDDSGNQTNLAGRGPKEGQTHQDLDGSYPSSPEQTNKSAHDLGKRSSGKKRSLEDSNVGSEADNEGSLRAWPRNRRTVSPERDSSHMLASLLGLNKGKGKMSADDVERMNVESQVLPGEDREDEEDSELMLAVQLSRNKQPAIPIEEIRGRHTLFGFTFATEPTSPDT